MNGEQKEDEDGIKKKEKKNNCEFESKERWGRRTSDRRKRVKNEKKC